MLVNTKASPKQDFKFSDPSDMTVISAVHNRGHGERVSNLLWSLANQTVTPQEVVIIDTSDDYEQSVSIATDCEVWGAVHIQAGRQEFNKCKSLNNGIRYARTRWVMCCDIDMMFAPDFMAVVLQRLERREKRLVLAVCGHLPQVTNGYIDMGWNELDMIVDISKLEHKYSPGAVQAASRDWFMRVRGYDEKFAGLGGMDTDSIDRAGRDEMDVNWIEFDEAQCYHQWHERSELKEKSSHLFLEDKSIVRNKKDSWGIL